MPLTKVFNVLVGETRRSDLSSTGHMAWYFEES